MTLKTKKILEMNAFDMKASALGNDTLISRRIKNLGAASVLFYRDPIEMKGAKGAWMFAAGNTRYLDFYNNVPSVGHCHPKVVEAISRQAAKLNIHTRYLSRVVDNYIETLKSTFPDNLDNVLLCCTGSEANDLALRLAHKRTGSRGIIVTETAYHGNTFAVTEISPAALKKNPLPDHVVSVKPPCAIHYGDDISNGFARAVEAAIGELNERGHGFAGLICDSIFSSDGVHCDPQGFLKGAVTAVKAYGGLYIADEVQPGFGRTGTHMWGFQRHGVIPDIVTMGKPMGNGFPMAGIAAQSDDINRFCEDVGYFNTFGGNPVAAAAGQAVLDIIRDEGLMENASRIGTHIIGGLKNIQSQHPVISDVRGAGLFIGIDICRQGDASKPDPKMTSDLINALRDRHILIGAAGKYGNTFKMRPPLCLTEEEANIFLTTMEDALGRMAI